MRQRGMKVGCEEATHQWLVKDDAAPLGARRLLWPVDPSVVTASKGTGGYAWSPAQQHKETGKEKGCEVEGKGDARSTTDIHGGRVTLSLVVG